MMPLRHAWLPGMLLLAWLVVEARAEDAPHITGAGRASITEADVADLRTLARKVAGFDPGVLTWIFTEQNWPSDGSPRELNRATIYFSPTETGPGHWRGWSLRCTVNGPQFHYYPGAFGEEAGRWGVSKGNRITQYMVIPQTGETLPDTPAGFLGNHPVIGVTTGADSTTVTDIVMTARGFSLMQRDGSELPFAPLPMRYVAAGIDSGGRLAATIRVDIPGADDFCMMRLQQETHGWKIVRAYRTMCEGF